MSDPSVTFESVTFSDGTTISLDQKDIVVLVGPNNAGKSLALRELEGYLASESNTTVLKNVTFNKSGSVTDLEDFLGKNVQIKKTGRGIQYSGYRLTLVIRPGRPNLPLLAK